MSDEWCCTYRDHTYKEDGTVICGCECHLTEEQRTPPKDDDKPNPGSEEAKAQGCICAVMDNNHGKWAPFPPDGWWITVGCGVHHPED